MRALQDRVRRLEERLDRIEPHVDRTIPMGPGPFNYKTSPIPHIKPMDQMYKPEDGPQSMPDVDEKPKPKFFSRDILGGSKPVPTVDRSKVTLTDGSPVTPGHREIKENGQQRGYVVLSAEERAKGLVRPVRQSYVHVGHRPTMSGGEVVSPVTAGVA